MERRAEDGVAVQDGRQCPDADGEGSRKRKLAWRHSFDHFKEVRVPILVQNFGPLKSPLKSPFNILVIQNIPVIVPEVGPPKNWHSKQ